MLFKHVVTGLDLSQRTHRVAAFASSLARGLGADLTMVHADTEEAARLRSLPSWAAIEAATAAVRERVGASVGAAGSQVLLRVGSPEGVLQAEAERLGAALIVIGSGATETTPDVGVTTTRCLRSVTLPLAIVPTHLQDDPPPVRHLLVPVDLDTATLETLKIGNELSRALNARITVVHVVRPPMLGGLLGSQEHDADVPGLVRELVIAADAELTHQVRAAELHHATTRVVEAVRPADGISALADSIGADLIILPARGRGAVARFFLGSTSERLLRLSNVPVMVLPASWLETAR